VWLQEWTTMADWSAGGQVGKVNNFAGTHNRQILSQNQVSIKTWDRPNETRE